MFSLCLMLEKIRTQLAIEFCNDDKFVMFAGTEKNLQVYDLNTLNIRYKIPLDQESMTKLTLSKLSTYIVYMASSFGNFYVFDVRGNGQITQKEKVHSDVLIDFVLTKEEHYAVTSSLDKTINLVKIIK